MVKIIIISNHLNILFNNFLIPINSNSAQYVKNIVNPIWLNNKKL